MRSWPTDWNLSIVFFIDDTLLSLPLCIQFYNWFGSPLIVLPSFELNWFEVCNLDADHTWNIWLRGEILGNIAQTQRSIGFEPKLGGFFCSFKEKEVRSSMSYLSQQVNAWVHIKIVLITWFSREFSIDHKRPRLSINKPPTHPVII